ncbi:MAG: hypothetical protein AAB460_00330 [Patescibacteria group bacterium]
MVAAAEAECEVVVRDVILGSATLATPPRLDFLVPRHGLSAVATHPVGLLAEDSRIELAPLLTDVLPLRPVVKAHAVATLTVWALLLTFKIVMVHNNPPFWPPIFLGATYYNTRNQIKVKPNKKSAPLPFLILKVMNSVIKKFLFFFLLKHGPSRLFLPRKSNSN